MLTKTTELKIYGLLMFYFGILDLAYLAMDIQEVNTLLTGYSHAVTIGVYVFFVVCILITLAKFWMGRQALRYAKGVGKGSSHIKLAKIGIVFGILVVVSDMFAAFNDTASITEAVSSLVNLFIYYFYYSTAKACL